MRLSGPQIALHWNNQHGWGAVCHANQWHTEGGLLVPGAIGAERSQWHERVWAYADMPSLSRCAPADRLRKGCYMFALGTLKSLTEFDNEDFDRVLNKFALLINPEDPNAVQDHLAYEKYDSVKRQIANCKRLGIDCDLQLPDHPGERRRHLAFIRQNGCPDALLRDRFNGRDPEEMSLAMLRQLTMTLKGRRPYPRRQRETAGIECPF